MISSLWRRKCRNCGTNKSCVFVSLRIRSNRNSQQRMNITFCVKLPRVIVKSVQCSLNLAAQKMWETERFFGAIHSSNRVEKPKDDERGVCLKKHRRSVFKPTLSMERGVVILVISCTLFILSKLREHFKFNLISRSRDLKRFRHNKSYAYTVLGMILLQFSLSICRQM